MAAPSIEIQYCVPCGHLPRALDIQRELLEHFGQRIDGIKLKTGADGIFKIRLNGEEIYNKTEELNLESLKEQIAAAAS